ncbi:MAG: hypothetical protein JW750_05175 [Anaerolineaceae bacterium]|nr:hypothetical protein [Anaerolineaceae bacterium]
MKTVEIRVKGLLDIKWSDWFEGFTFIYTEQKETILKGQITDQAALFGLLGKMRDLGLSLIAVKIDELEEGQGSDSA